MSSTVKTPSSFEGQEKSVTNNSVKSIEQVDEIFQSVKSQINQWGENAKWKIDLVLLDNPNQQSKLNTTNTTTTSTNTHPLLSPQNLHPNAFTALDSKNQPPKNAFTLPITPTTQYPWDYVAPRKNEYNDESDELHQKLRVSLERQQHLENIIKAQAEQLKSSNASNYNDSAINTMKNIFLMSQNEQKIHYLAETDLLHKDIDVLSKKLKKMAAILEKIETMDLSNEEKELVDKDTLLNDRKILSRKLCLAELRLSARDTEIDYLNELIDTLKTNLNHFQELSRAGSASPKSHLQKKLKKGPPYLFQQQFSPRSEVRSSEQYPLSALDSLGIVADQMLSDPEFENTTQREKPEKRLRSRLDDRRSQRSIDSATTLLALPQLVNLPKTIPEDSKSSTSPSPEPYKLSSYDHIPKKPRSTYTRWTVYEDKLLRQAVKKYGHSNWEACAKEISGRSNIQCRNRWIRHLEHRPAPSDEETNDEMNDNKIQLYQNPKLTQTSSNNNSARHSPSIAALLNSTDNDDGYRYSPKAPPRQLYQESSSSNRTNYLLPSYRPPSPITTPKNENGKRRAPDSMPISRF